MTAGDLFLTALVAFALGIVAGAIRAALFPDKQTHVISREAFVAGLENLYPNLGWNTNDRVTGDTIIAIFDAATHKR